MEGSKGGKGKGSKMMKMDGEKAENCSNLVLLCNLVFEVQMHFFSSSL